MAKMTPMEKSICMYFVNLEKKLADVLAVPENLRPPGAKETIKHLEILLGKKDTTSWHDAYLAEQILASILPEPMLDQEINCHLAKAKDMLDSKVVEDYEKNKPGTPEGKRAQLAGLLADLQWAYNMRSTRRDCLRRATITGSVFFLGAFLFFATIIAMGSFPRLLNHMLPDVIFLLNALAAGLLGASYSTLTSLRAPLEDMPIEKYQTMSSVWYILSRILIGLCAALVLYFMLQAELVTGDILPQIATLMSKVHVYKDSMDTDYSTAIKAAQDIWMKNLSLVVVYCFLAGFSEKLVPNLLTRVEKRVTANDGA
ncbi:hypothetical protein [Desulfocurvus sp. DL9XJH121]